MFASVIRPLFIALLALSGAATLTGCGNDTANTDAGGNSTAISLGGAVFKGPIDNAQINVLTQDGTVLASSVSNAGRFALSGLEIPDNTSLLFIESVNGQYTDEATGTIVDAGGKGLMTVFTVDELKTIAGNQDIIAMTPETTIVARLVKSLVSDGMSASRAIGNARSKVQNQLIDNTLPITASQGENLLLTGNLAAASSVDTSEALARNRAAGFSFQTQRLNLSPDQVFELLDKTADDLKDGTLDGKDAFGQSLNIVDRNGNPVDLGKLDHKTDYALARTRSLNQLVDRYNSGMASTWQTAELQQMGIDTGFFTRLLTENNNAASQTAANLAATDLPDFRFLPVLPDEDGDTADSNATYTLTATDNVNVIVNAPGTSWNTTMMRYNSSQLPPVIIARRGDNLTLNLVNNLDEETTIHWHGFKIPGDQDGGPDFPVAAGGSKQYSFSLQQPAASLWFHPHPHLKTAEQVYRGLTGVFLIKDDITDALEAANALPSGQYDIPVLIQDRRFAEDDGSGTRALRYRNQPWDNHGMIGNEILVNGTVLPKLEVDTHHYRFRLYNASNARSYLFALSNGASFTVVGTDGGLLAKPVEVTELQLAAGERAEIVIDFRNYNVGDKVMLVSKAFNGASMMAMRGMAESGGFGTGGMGMMMPGGGMNPSGMAINGRHADIMRFDISNQVSDETRLYASLPDAAEINSRLAENDADNNRDFILGMDMPTNGMSGIRYLINGKSFDINRVDEQIDLTRGNTEIWSISNLTPMAHPFHAHAIQWQILDRNGVAASGIDLGWKDTVLVQPGETVRIIGRFDPVINTGRYMYHCHILEHEDGGMMGSFEFR